jgi:2'-hydroxyisoflavone reductase
MRLLVLGGTRFAGRAVVSAALAVGDEVTTLNRGVSRVPEPGVTALVADRTDPAALRAALGNGEWDAIIDTWSGAPRVAADSASLLAGRAEHYGYVSSISVYSWPMPDGFDESAPLAEGDPDSDDTSDYAAAKRGAELGVLGAFGPRALIARAGLILGPWENIGRLPWWLRRIERGGRVLAPGDPARPLQLIDVRDLAGFMLASARAGAGGTYSVTSPPGYTTIGELLTTAVAVTGSDAELTWVSQEVLAEAGIEPWTELPCWVPLDEEYRTFLTGDVSAAVAAGLTLRPVAETVAAAWAWLQAEGDPPPRPGQIGLDPAKEQAALAAPC